jgi:hypothetical protein
MIIVCAIFGNDHVTLFPSEMGEESLPFLSFSSLLYSPLEPKRLDRFLPCIAQHTELVVRKCFCMIDNVRQILGGYIIIIEILFVLIVHNNYQTKYKRCKQNTIEEKK